MNRDQVQILAPAGSYESLTAAGQAGADSVYFGIGELNMRARSSANFTEKDLPGIVGRASEFGMKACLALNTVVYDKEIDRMKKVIEQAVQQGIAAIIASDSAVLEHCRRLNVPVHLSTQLNISNAEALKFYSPFAEVAVLSRELNLEQVKKISEAIVQEGIRGPSGKRMRIEMFIHGALCMAISGKCYLSLHHHGHSANRGECFQVCRRGYRVTDLESEVEMEVDNEYIMSPKDLKTIHFLDRILDAGVTVLKIEGRARSAEYVKTVTGCYNEAIAACLEGTYTKERIGEWDKRLASVFNRGFWDGYYLGRPLGEWSNTPGSQATFRKEYAGKGTNYFDKIGVAEMLVESGTLRMGDRILIIGPTTGVVEATITELRVHEEPCDRAGKGERCTFPVDRVVRRSDKVYKLVPRDLLS